MLSPKRANLFMIFLLLYQFSLRMLFSYIFMVYESDFYSNSLFIVISQILNFAFPFFIYFQKTGEKSSAFLPARKLNFTNTGLVILMSVAIQPVMMILSGITSLFFENRVPSAISSLNDYPVIVLLTVFALSPAILEELVFRGIIFTNYRYVNIKTAAFMNGLFFALMHMDPHQFGYAFALGIMLTCIAYYTRSILASMLAHFVINFTQIIISLQSESVKINIVSLLVIAAVMLPVFIIIYNAFVSYNRRINNAIEILTYINGDDETRPTQHPKLALWTLIPMLLFFGFYMIVFYIA